MNNIDDNRSVDFSNEQSIVSVETKNAGCSSICSVMGDLISDLFESIAHSKVKHGYEPKKDKFARVLTIPEENTIDSKEFNKGFVHKVQVISKAKHEPESKNYCTRVKTIPEDTMAAKRFNSIYAQKTKVTIELPVK